MIDELRSYIGASKNNALFYNSEMLEKLSLGIVTTPRINASCSKADFGAFYTKWLLPDMLCNLNIRTRDQYAI